MELSEMVSQPARSRQLSAMSAALLNLPRAGLGELMSLSQKLDVWYAKSLTFFASSNLMITVRVFCDVDAAPVDRPALLPAPPRTSAPPPKISAATPPLLVE